jgi:hypothetical protein
MFGIAGHWAFVGSVRRQCSSDGRASRCHPNGLRATSQCDALSRDRASSSRARAVECVCIVDAHFSSRAPLSVAAMRLHELGVSSACSTAPSSIHDVLPGIIAWRRSAPEPRCALAVSHTHVRAFRADIPSASPDRTGA